MGRIIRYSSRIICRIVMVVVVAVMLIARGGFQRCHKIRLCCGGGSGCGLLGFGFGLRLVVLCLRRGFQGCQGILIC
eukprot:scaffold637546_cov67-Attheya_sp.AAC.1